MLQQYLPFTVLKLTDCLNTLVIDFRVATVPTVYGIETYLIKEVSHMQNYEVATVPTVYGIETVKF